MELQQKIQLKDRGSRYLGHLDNTFSMTLLPTIDTLPATIWPAGWYINGEQSQEHIG